MKSGWLFVTAFVCMVLELIILHKYHVAETANEALWNFASWIHAHPLLELCFWAVILVVGFTVFLYSLYKMFKSLEW